MTNRHGEFKVNKLFLILLLGVIIVLAGFQPQEEQQAKAVGQNAMQVAIDPVDGTLVRPNLTQRQALKKQQQALLNDSEKFQYRNTLTVHPNGTKSGVVDPQFLHSIYATRNAAGEIVLHEGREIVPQQPALEVR